MSSGGERNADAPLVFGMAAVAVCAGIATVLPSVGLPGWVASAAAVSAAASALLILRRSKGPGRSMRVLLYGLAALMGAHVVVLASAVIEAGPGEWDFLTFYLDGVVSGSGLNLYVPEHYAFVVQRLGLEVSPEFRREIVEVGFKYPPPTVFLFRPLALWPIQTAHAIWIAVLTATTFLACVLGALLIPRAPAPAHPLVDFADRIAFCVVAVWALGGARIVLRLGQTGGFLLCLTMAVLLANGRALSGVASTVAVIVKPIFAVPAALLVLGRRWRAVGAAIITTVAAVVLSVLAVGLDDWSTYLTQEYATASPAWLYHEENNQSLLATLSRAAGITGHPWSSPGVVAAYACISLVVVVVSFTAAVRAEAADFAYALCLVLLAGLIVYPGTQHSYGILLGAPVVVEMRRRLRLGAAVRPTLAFFVAVYATASPLPFVGNALLWLFFLRTLQQR